MINKEAVWDAETLGITYRDERPYKSASGKWWAIAALAITIAFLVEWAYLLIMLNSYVA
jgi:hypothetical protein